MTEVHVLFSVCYTRGFFVFFCQEMAEVFWVIKIKSAQLILLLISSTKQMLNSNLVVMYTDVSHSRNASIPLSRWTHTQYGLLFMHV